MNTEIQNIRIDDIQPSPNNTRKKVNAEELEGLAKSIKAVGVIQPITVRPQLVSCGDEYDDYFEIVCGHRRYEAAKLAGLESVPCIIRNISDEEAHKIIIIENLQRENVGPFDESKGFHDLKMMGHDIDSIAEIVGKSKTYIYSRLRLANLIQGFKDLYNEGKMELTHCLILSQLETKFQEKVKTEYYDTDKTYLNITGKGTKELKWAIERLGHKVADAMFNNDGCKNCQNRTDCNSLFGDDIANAICSDPECWNRKCISKSLEEFEKARERYEDFFVIEPGKLTDEIDIKLEQYLRERGFKFVKDDSYKYDSVGSRYSAENDRIVGFSFDWKGFLAPAVRKESATTSSNRWKSDWSLDRLAKEREGRTKEIEMQAGLAKLTEMPDEEMLNRYRDYGWELVKHQLVLFASMADGCEFSGIKGGSDPKEITEKVAKMESGKIASALVRFIASYEDTEDVTFLSKAFPEPFKGNRAEAERKFLDECREAWHGYDEVTDEMIEEDLKNRINKK